jgi:hypothetical protein
MDFDEHKKKTDQVLLEAKRVINEANIALKRTEDYFFENNIDTNKIMKYVLDTGGPEAVRELELMVERTLREMQEEANRAVEISRLQNSVPSARKKFRKLI